MWGSSFVGAYPSGLWKLGGASIEAGDDRARGPQLKSWGGPKGGPGCFEGRAEEPEAFLVDEKSCER